MVCEVDGCIEGRVAEWTKVIVVEGQCGDRGRMLGKDQAVEKHAYFR